MPGCVKREFVLADCFELWGSYLEGEANSSDFGGRSLCHIQILIQYVTDCLLELQCVARMVRKLNTLRVFRKEHNV